MSVRRRLLLGPAFTVLLLVAAAGSARADAASDLRPAASHPPDPFANEYVVPEARETGTTAGQFRMVASGLVGIGRAGWELGLAGTLELMTYAYLGVRGSLQANILRPSGEPFVFAAKTGPSLHLFPYRPVDVSLFFEAGVAAVDPFADHAAAMPVVSPGGTVEIWLGQALFLRAEGHIDWGIYASADAPRGYLRFVGLGGLGLAL